jgi:L-threonylcarbamoyladenylate synthase
LTRVIHLDPLQIDALVIAQAAESVRQGGLVAFPTETVYGLGANALNAAAVAHIFEAKCRPGRNPLIVHVPGASQARSLTLAWPEAAEILTARFWPGPLTIILPKHPKVPDIVTGGGPNVGLRAPAQPIAQALLQAAGVPIAAPSANRSTELSPTTAQHVVHSLGERVDLVLDGGPTTAGIESTVLDLTCNPPRILRPGPIGVHELESCIGAVLSGPTETLDSIGPLAAPGLMARHYAPRATLVLAPDEGLELVRQLAGGGHRVGWLVFADTGEHAPALVSTVLMPKDATAYAARLYAVLHELDAAGVDAIVAARVPESRDWIAIRDRLTRAATA